ncbi:MAG: aminotransferase class IV [Saprospirales bacterium]|nr:aminotransferase class IV [Saprospirales bacterium]
MNLINFNGAPLPASTPLFPAGHRGLRYGDGLFETIRYRLGEMPFLPQHLERLLAGMRALGMDIPPSFGVDFFEGEIRKILPEGDHARLRLSVYRQGGGLYAPESNAVDFLIEAAPIQEPESKIPQSGILTGFPVSPTNLSPYKTANSLPYILASAARKERNWEEGILMNPAGRVADGCHSNVFAILNGIVYTPPVSEGALAGVMRSVVLQQAGLQVKVSPISSADLAQAEEIWFTNAIQGVRWVENFEGRKLKNTVWHEFFADPAGLWDNKSPITTPWINS